MSHAGTADRFLRPDDLGRTRRNHRRLQAQRILVLCANVLLVASVAIAALWLYRRTQEDVRFKVTRIEATGVVHAPPAVLDAVRRQYLGANLFRLDIAELQRDLRSVAWIRSIAIEKKLPNTLVIHVTERRPMALVLDRGALRYVDEEGVVFSDLSPAVGDPSLPVLTGEPGDLQRCVRFLGQLRAASPQLYSRVSELSPVDPTGFAIFDRDLAARVFVSGYDAVEKWTALYQVARAEAYGRGAIEYADLRFRDRLVIKARKVVAVQQLPVTAAKNEITN